MSHVLKNYLLFIWNLTRHPVFYLALLHNLERIWSIIYRILWLQLETWIWERLGRPVRRPGHGTVREMGRVNRKHKGIWKAICTSQTSCQGNRTLSLDRMGKDSKKWVQDVWKYPPDCLDKDIKVAVEASFLCLTYALMLIQWSTLLWTQTPSPLNQTAGTLWA